jgi:hypothetical protein
MQTQKIEIYLARLRTGLEARSLAGSTDIIEEIRSYLVEAASAGDDRLDAAIEDLGSPEELSSSYHSEAKLAGALRHARQGQLLVLMLKGLGRNSVASAAALASLPLYVMCGAFAWLALLKLLRPEGVPGVVGKFNLGALVRTPQAHDIFGWILLPFGLLMAAFCFAAASYLLKRGAQHLLRTHRQSWRTRHAF